MCPAGDRQLSCRPVGPFDDTPHAMRDLRPRPEINVHVPMILMDGKHPPFLPICKSAHTALHQAMRPRRFERIPLDQWPAGEELWSFMRDPYERAVSSYRFAFPGPRSRYGEPGKTVPVIHDEPTFAQWLTRLLTIGDQTRDRHCQSQLGYTQGKVTHWIRWDFEEFARVFETGVIAKKNPSPPRAAEWTPELLHAFRSDEPFALDLLTWHGYGPFPAGAPESP